jgi:hypothetical protein
MRVEETYSVNQIQGACVQKVAQSSAAFQYNTQAKKVIESEAQKTPSI